jgi:LacI family transcriptional regulator
VTTIYDVARVAGVSTATVSRVLRGSDRVRADTRQRVLGVIDALGFTPDASARGLSWGRKGIIALVGLNRGTDEIDIERSSLMFIDQIVHAAEQVLRGTEYSLLLTFGVRGEQFDKRIRALAAKADGLLLAEGILDPGELRSLTAQVPVVVIAGSPGQAVADAYLSDNAGGMTALAAHLTGQHRYRRLCLVAGPKDAPDAVARQAASRPARTAASTRSSTGTSRRTAASRPPGSCSAARPCRRLWRARTTRWRSAWCASCSGRASESRRTWR